MSFFKPGGPPIPGSSNNDTSYAKLLRVNTLTDGILTINNGTISNLNDPVNPKDAANKEYVESAVSGPFGNITALSLTTPLVTGLLPPTNSSDAANKQYVDAQISNPGSIEYQVIVQKDPSIGQFLTIEDALASITDAAIDKPYCVYVGPGIYYENPLIVPQYVSIRGESINTTIVSPLIPNQYLFILNTNVEISFMTLQGIAGSVSPGPGSGYPAVYCEDVGDFAQMHKISIYDFDVCIENYSNAANSNLYVEYTDVNGNYSYAIINRSGTTPTAFLTYTSLENFYSYPSASTVKTVIQNNGVNTYLILSACNLSGDTGMRGIDIKNGGELNITATLFTNFDNTAIYSENIGDGATIRIDACTFVNCDLDFSIQNVNTSGFFFGNSPRENHFIVDNSTFFVAGEDSNVINVAKSGGDYTSIKVAIDSITDSSSSNPYVVKVGPGIFIEDPITMKQGVFLLGSMTGGTIISPSISTGTIIIGIDGSLVRDLFLTGASGIGGKAIYLEGTTGAGMLIRDCGFTTNETHVHIHGAAATTVAVVDRCSVTGNMTTGFKATNVGSVTVRLTLSIITYQDLTLPVCTYFAYAEGTNVLLTTQNLVLRTFSPSSAIAFYLDNGVEARIATSIIKGFDKIIYVPSGGTTSTVYVDNTIYSEISSYLVDINNDTTLGFWDGQTDYTKLNIPLNAPFFVSYTDATLIRVQKKGGDFTSIVDALNSITQNNTTNRFIINVGPGRFVEPEIVMKEFVSIHGSGRSTVIEPDANNHHIIRGCDFSELTSFIVSGAGPGYAAIYQETPTGAINTSLICRGVLFGLNDTHVWTYGNVGTANVILFNSRYGGTAPFNYGFKATNNNNSVASKITIIGTVSQNFASPLPEYVCYASGENCTISVNSFNAINNGPIETGTYGFKVDNGGFIRLLATTIRGFDTAIASINAGSAPEIISSGCTITDCNTDINIDHPDTMGSIDASADRTKVIVADGPPISIFLVDPVNSGIAFSGPLLYSSSNYNNLTDISFLITETSTMGVLSGGTLSIDSGLTVAIAEGTGYNETAGGILTYRTWNNSTLLLPANSNVYIVINSNGIVSSSASYPNSVNNIVLGLVSTNATDIIYIQQTPLNALHWSNFTSTLLREAIGPIYSSGSSVAETGSRQLNVSQGSYFYSANQFLPGGGNPVTFNIYYRSATPGIYTPIVSQTTVPNTSYDDGSGTLQPLTISFYTKHLLLLLGGPSEVYALIYGQAEYATSGLAEAAGLPLTPSFITDAFVRVVSIVVQEGNANIVSFIDERPRIGFASSSVTGAITVHGDLLGLAANDHPQYLLVDGSAPGMTGDLNLNGNNIIDPGLYNGFNVSAHASRHAFNGADPLSPALAANIAEISDSVAFAGINNSLIPRADHQHPHGNRGGGTLHAAVVASGASGFMTGTDKAKLDGIQAGATNTTPSNTAPVNVDVSAASAGVSAEVSRQDHKHNISTASAVGLTTSSTNSEGSSTSVARADHTHAISSDVPVTQTPDQTNTLGNSTSFARADHIHNIPTGVAVSLNANSTSTQGAATTFSRSNHSHAIASGPPSNQTIALSTATGTSVNFARADHIHTFSTGVPSSVGSANDEGVSTSFARSDHIHNITLSGPISSTGTTTSVTSQTGTGSTFVMNNGPTLIAPVLGSATGTSLTTTGSITTKTSLILEDPGVGTNTVSLIAPTLASSYTLTLPVDDGVNGQILATDGSGGLVWSNTGLNVVTNAGSSTDTALARFSGTTGKIIQNSTVLLSGAGALTGISTLNMSGQLTSTVSTGTAPFVVASTTQVANLTAEVSSNSTITDDTTSNITVYPTWVTTNSGNLPQKVTSTKLSFNPSNGLLTSTGFSGSLTNATGLPLSTGVTGILSGTNGGTGINNGTKTITLGGSLITSGAFDSTFTMTGTTNVTFPTSGTLLNNSLTSGNILVGSAGNLATSVTMSGDATINNTGVLTLAPTVRQPVTTLITAGVTYTTPATITTSTNFKFILIGGGGGGGGTNTNNSHGAGGGGGGVGILYINGLTPSTGYTIAIGIAGTAGTAGPGAGGAGGTTSITIGATTYTATGGSGGAAGGGTGVGGAAGITTNCTISINGETGGYTATTASNLVTSGKGGSSGLGYGLGGAGVAGANNATITGINGTGYGAGGSGSTGVGRTGGAGSQGAIIVEYIV